MSAACRADLSQTSRLGRWLPGNRKHLAKWLRDVKANAQREARSFHPVIREFQDLIERDPILYMYFTEMFAEQPSIPIDPKSGDIKLESYQEMLVVLNHILTTAPVFDQTGMVGFPINAILDYPMITPGGLAAFADTRVNAILRKILTTWAQFLDSESSCYVLNDSPTGWLNPEARRILQLDQFQTVPGAPHLGFRSWNDFFIRQFKPGQRPVAQPENDKAIVSACESSPFSIQPGVRERDLFWIKKQPYSLYDLLNGNFVDEFIGGTVYQAFLSATNYHRWHSPVSGVIRKVQNIPGTYYSEAASMGFDPVGPNNSQGYIAHVATRALVFIEAADPRIGLLCVALVGMAEVSSCALKHEDGRPLGEGDHVKKGDQIGYFQFGGSTHCLVFRPNVIDRFVLQAIPRGENGEDSPLVPVNSLLAIAQ